MNKAEDLVANEVANGFGVIVKNSTAAVGAADVNPAQFQFLRNQLLLPTLMLLKG